MRTPARVVRIYALRDLIAKRLEKRKSTDIPQRELVRLMREQIAAEHRQDKKDKAA
jgi:hypothetical protein